MSRNEKVHTFLMDCMADALIERMKEKPFEKITADEIAETAGVGRATYFRSFASKQEVLTYKFIRHWEIHSEKRNLKERKKFDISNAVDFFEINFLLKDIFDVVYAAGQQSSLHEAFSRIMVTQAQNNNRNERYRERFYSYGLFGLLDEWIKSGYKDSPQQMAALLTQIVNSPIQNI